MLPGPAQPPPHPAQHKCQAEAPPSATCPSRQCHTRCGGTAHHSLQGALSQSLLALGVERASAVVGGWGDRGSEKGKDLSIASRDLVYWGLERTQAHGDRAPAMAQGLDPWSAGGQTWAIQASTFAGAPHSANPTHSGVPTLLLFCWLRRLQDVTLAVPAPKESH